MRGFASTCAFRHVIFSYNKSCFAVKLDISLGAFSTGDTFQVKLRWQDVLSVTPESYVYEIMDVIIS